MTSGITKFREYLHSQGVDDSQWNDEMIREALRVADTRRRNSEHDDAARGRMMIPVLEFLKNWWDHDEDGRLFERYGIAVGPPRKKTKALDDKPASNPEPAKAPKTEKPEQQVSGGGAAEPPPPSDSSSGGSPTPPEEPEEYYPWEEPTLPRPNTRRYRESLPKEKVQAHENRQLYITNLFQRVDTQEHRFYNPVSDPTFVLPENVQKDQIYQAIIQSIREDPTNITSWYVLYDRIGEMGAAAGERGQLWEHIRTTVNKSVRWDIAENISEGQLVDQLNEIPRGTLRVLFQSELVSQAIERYPLNIDVSQIPFDTVSIPQYSVEYARRREIPQYQRSPEQIVNSAFSSMDLLFAGIKLWSLGIMNTADRDSFYEQYWKPLDTSRHELTHLHFGWQDYVEANPGSEEGYRLPPGYISTFLKILALGRVAGEVGHIAARRDYVPVEDSTEQKHGGLLSFVFSLGHHTLADIIDASSPRLATTGANFSRAYDIFRPRAIREVQSAAYTLARGIVQVLQGTKGFPDWKTKSVSEEVLRKTPRSGPPITGGPVIDAPYPRRDGTGSGPGAYQFNEPSERVKSLEPKRFSLLKFNLSDAISSNDPSEDVKKIQGSIAPEDLTDDGIETKPHITLLYGMETDDPAQAVQAIQQWLRATGKQGIRVFLGDITVFPASDPETSSNGQVHDVLKLDVNGDDIRLLHQFLAERIPHIDTHAEYSPHLSLAELTAGMSWLYVGDGLGNREVIFDKVVFSDRNRNQTPISLVSGRGAKALDREGLGLVPGKETNAEGWRVPDEDLPGEWGLLSAGSVNQGMEKPGGLTTISDQSEWEREHSDRWGRSEERTADTPEDVPPSPFGKKFHVKAEGDRPESGEPSSTNKNPSPVSTPNDISNQDWNEYSSERAQTPTPPQPEPPPQSPPTPPDDPDRNIPDRSHVEIVNGEEISQTPPERAYRRLDRMEVGFRQDIRENPEDSSGPLIYADWLEESGIDSNVALAEYIRLQNRIDEIDSAGESEGFSDESLELRNTLLFRINELRSEYEEAWLGPWSHSPSRVNFNGLVSAIVGPGHFRRLIVGNGPEILTWVDTLNLTTMHRGDNDNVYTDLFDSNEWAASIPYLVNLDFSTHVFDDTALGGFINSLPPNGSDIRTINLGNSGISYYGLLMIAHAPKRLPHLRSIKVGGLVGPLFEDWQNQPGSAEAVRELMRAYGPDLQIINDRTGERIGGQKKKSLEKSFAKPSAGNDFYFYRRTYDRWRTKPNVIDERRIHMAYERGTDPSRLAVRNDEEWRLTEQSNTKESQLFQAARDASVTNSQYPDVDQHEPAVPNLDETHIETDPLRGPAAKSIRLSPFGRKAMEDESSSEKPKEPEQQAAASPPPVSPPPPPSPLPPTMPPGPTETAIPERVEDTPAPTDPTPPAPPPGDDPSKQPVAQQQQFNALSVFQGSERYQELPAQITSSHEYPSFLQAIQENPDDVSTKMIFADFLEERGATEPAQRIRNWYDFVNPEALKRVRGDLNEEPPQSYADYGAEIGHYLPNDMTRVVYLLSLDEIFQNQAVPAPPTGMEIPWGEGWSTERVLREMGELRGRLELGAFGVLSKDQIHSSLGNLAERGPENFFIRVQDMIYAGIGEVREQTWANPEASFGDYLEGVSYYRRLIHQIRVLHSTYNMYDFIIDLPETNSDGMLGACLRGAPYYRLPEEIYNERYGYSVSLTYAQAIHNVSRGRKSFPAWLKKSIYTQVCPDGTPRPLGRSSGCSGHQANSWDGVVDKNNESDWPEYPDYAPVTGLDTRPKDEQEEPIVGPAALAWQKDWGVRCPDGSAMSPNHQTCDGQEGFVPYTEEERLQHDMLLQPGTREAAIDHRPGRGPMVGKYPNQKSIRPSPFYKRKELDQLGGEVPPPNEMEAARKADFVTLPEGITGTNCGNCTFAVKKKSGTTCGHKKLLGLPINERNCCILPGAHIHNELLLVSESWYTGEAVDIRTLSGKRLALTINHPVLTENGLVSAGNLKQGNHLIRDLFEIKPPEYRGSIPTEKNKQNTPPVIEEIFSSLQAFGFTVKKSTPLDFHGDGKFIQGNIKIVGSHSFLSFARYSLLKKEADYRVFSSSHFGEIDFSCNCNSDSFIMSEISATRLHSCNRFLCPSSSVFCTGRSPNLLNFFSSPFRMSNSCFWSHISPLDSVALLERSGLHSSLFQKSLDDCHSQSSVFADHCDGFPGFVPGDYESWINATKFWMGDLPSEDLAFSHISEFDSRFCERLTKREASDPRLLRQIIDTFPSEVSLDEIIEIKRFHYDGPVYDGQTSSGLIIADGLYISNCALWDSDGTIRAWENASKRTTKILHPEQDGYRSLEAVDTSKNEIDPALKAMSAYNTLSGGALLSPPGWGGPQPHYGKLEDFFAKTKSLPPRQEGHKPVLAVDVDGTLCDTPPHGDGPPPAMEELQPREGAVEAMQHFHRTGWHIIIWTCRDDYEEVEKWLNYYSIPFDEINMAEDQEIYTIFRVPTHEIDAFKEYLEKMNCEIEEIIHP